MCRLQYISYIIHSEYFYKSSSRLFKNSKCLFKGADLINSQPRNTIPIYWLLVFLLPFPQNYSVFAETASKFSTPSSLSLKEQGARRGQALAASRFCPGARLTEKAEKLDATLNEQEIAIFAEHSQKVEAAWEKAFTCTDVDPAQTREINGCRRAKILSCTMTWKEIGPEGTALQGLLEFKP